MVSPLSIKISTEGLDIPKVDYTKAVDPGDEILEPVDNSGKTSKGKYKLERTHDKQGRPLGSKDRNPRRPCSAKELMDRLSYDPLVEQIHLYDKAKKTLKWHERVRDGELKGFKYSAKNHSDAMVMVQNLHNSLMRYGYARVSEVAQEERVEPPRLVIELSTSESYNKPEEDKED